MSSIFSELNKEAEQQQQSLANQQQKSAENQKPKRNKQIDVQTSPSDVPNRRRTETADQEKLKIIITELSTIPVTSSNTPVRLSATEKQDIEDFIHGTLRKRGLRGKSVSGAKLMRYALRYMMKVKQKEFIDALEKTLKKEEKLSI